MVRRSSAFVRYPAWQAGECLGESSVGLKDEYGCDTQPGKLDYSLASWIARMMEHGEAKFGM